MASLDEVEFIAQIKDRISSAKFVDGVQSFTFCRGKFSVPSQRDYTYNMFLRITDCGGDMLNVNLDYPKSSISIRSNHPFFHKLKARIKALCGPEIPEDAEPPQPKFRTSLPNPFENYNA